MTEELKQTLRVHMEADQRLFEQIVGTLTQIQVGQDKIKDNHLFHLEKDMATVTTNVEWLMKNHWLVVAAAIGALFSGLGALTVGLINLLTK